MRLILGIVASGLLVLTAAAKDKPVYEPGLLAHYYSDPVNWDGNWPDKISTPQAKAKDWTFTKYQYTRVEPVVNHEFIKSGWFSVRWTGLLDTRGTGDDGGVTCALEGTLNINPNNGLHEITVEYFQGQSLEEGDADPMRLYWSCPQKKMPRQLVRPAHFFHVGTPDAQPKK